MATATPAPASGVPLDPPGETLFRGAATSDEDWKTISHMITGERLTDRWHAQQLAAFRKSVNTTAMLGFLYMWTATNFQKEVEGNNVPALILVGKHDFPAFTEEAMSQTLGQWYKRSKIDVFESSDIVN